MSVHGLFRRVLVTLNPHNPWPFRCEKCQPCKLLNKRYTVAETKSNQPHIDLAQTDPVKLIQHWVWTEPQQYLTTQWLATDAVKIILPESGVCRDGFFAEVAASRRNSTEGVATTWSQMGQQGGRLGMTNGPARLRSKGYRVGHNHRHHQTTVVVVELATQEDIFVVKVEVSAGWIKHIWYQRQCCLQGPRSVWKDSPVTNKKRFCKSHNREPLFIRYYEKDYLSTMAYIKIFHLNMAWSQLLHSSENVCVCVRMNKYISLWSFQYCHSTLSIIDSEGSLAPMCDQAPVCSYYNLTCLDLA